MPKENECKHLSMTFSTHDGYFICMGCSKSWSLADKKEMKELLEIRKTTANVV